MGAGVPGLPHAGSWQSAATIQKSAELNQPVKMILVHEVSQKINPGFSLLECQSDSVIISAFKLAEDQPAAGRYFILRLYEIDGKPSTAVIKFPDRVRAACETDLMETPVFPEIPVNHELTLSFAPFEIKTVRIHI